MKTERLMVNTTNSMSFSKKERIIYYTVFLVLFLSGVVWLVLHYLCSSVGEFGLMSNPLESKILCIHGVAAFGFAFVFGNIWAIHVKSGIQKKYKKNFKSGIINALLVTILIVTGLLLYYAGNDMVRITASMMHWICGILLFIVIIFHIFMGKYRKRKM